MGPNLYDDFGLEHHKMFHIDYVFACYRFHIQGAVMYWLTGRELPMAFHHHAQNVYEKLMLPLAANYRGQIDGKPILSAEDVRSGRGDDWSWAIRQDSSSGISEIFVSLFDEIVLFIEYAPAGALPAGMVVENAAAERLHK